MKKGKVNFKLTKDPELQRIIVQQEKAKLLFDTEALQPQSDILAREHEKISLRNGLVTSKREVQDLIVDLARDYTPMFPNKLPFFKLMFQLNGWDNLNPNDYRKPAICAKWIKQYIYGRFDRELLPSLLKKENPIIEGYIKKYKLFQFLNDEGVLLLEGYISEAIEIMKISKDWYDFELKYTALYNLSCQLKMTLQNNR